MYFTSNQLHKYLLNRANQGLPIIEHTIRSEILHEVGIPAHANVASLTKQQVDSINKEAHKRIVTRNVVGVGKWLRPWKVVPRLANFNVPEGDFGVGIEIELGFRNITKAQEVAKYLIKQRNTTLDFEGGANGIEATFPPELFSKFGDKSPPLKYLRKLNKLKNHVTKHSPGSHVGTHVNVTKGGVSGHYNHAVEARRLTVNRFLRDLSFEKKAKYFGRPQPYGYMYLRDKLVECKMFNSVTDPTALKRYVNTAVKLVDLLHNDTPITEGIVEEALETGYNAV